MCFLIALGKNLKLLLKVSTKVKRVFLLLILLFLQSVCGMKLFFLETPSITKAPR